MDDYSTLEHSPQVIERLAGPNGISVGEGDYALPNRLAIDARRLTSGPA